ncbi:MAG: signal recognition particle-docking protein FtsY [Alphaproteobacteria bacterium]|nr:signal recognition particle-docking protein FtsY [Alphaproteobacteria bacterium]
MVFWRKKKNIKDQEEQEHADAVIHHADDIPIKPPSECVVDSRTKRDVEQIDDIPLQEMDLPTVHQHTVESAAKEKEELRDHTEEGGWLSRLASGLSKSSNKFTKNISGLVTRKKLDEETLEQLEDILIESDLGPKTAANIIESFSKDRFGKDISEEEIKIALSESMEKILSGVAQKLVVKKLDSEPFVIVMCGVNGVGKTTTIGKLAYHLHYKEGKSVMMAAGDTFRAAAVEQLEEWANRSGSKFFSKSLGDDAASVAFEAYEEAKAQGVDVLFIDTAGRLHNKANLMAELEKIIRVLKKQNENLPHATLLVLDATTGQNAFAQLDTFKDMVDISGLIVTKLDGSAKGGVLVGLADQFGVPVHAIGIGEGIEDMQSFCAREYARSLVGLET